MKTFIITLSLMLIVVGMGCAALSHYVTPAEIDQGAVDYAITEGVADPDDYDSWWPNIIMAEQLMKDVDAAHKTRQQQLQHWAQKDDLKHSIHQGVATTNYTAAIQREEMLFGETGLLSLGLSMLGAGGFAGLLGLSRKRPGDITAPEMEQAVAQATGKTTEELSAKEKQFVQLVKGVQTFMNHPTIVAEGIPLELLRSSMNKAQDKDTQAAVAVVKKTS